MTWFNDLSLRGKLLLNFLVSGTLFIAAIIICYVQIGRVDELAGEVARNWLPSVQQAAKLSELRLRYRVRSLEYLLAAPADKAKVEKALGELDAITQQNVAMVEQLAAAASGLRDRSRALEEAVDLFRLADATPRRAADAVALRRQQRASRATAAA